jgi:hypothetical protein
MGSRSFYWTDPPIYLSLSRCDSSEPQMATGISDLFAGIPQANQKPANNSE